MSATADGAADPDPGAVLRHHTETTSRVPARDGLGVSALVLGGLATAFVAVAVASSAVAPLTTTGLALVSAGVVLAAAGLVLGTLGAVRARPGPSRTAMSGAGLSVAGLAGGLIWMAAFVILALTGPVPAPAGSLDTAPACAPVVCPGP